MLDILQQHLAAQATPETAASVQQAHALFERIGLEDYEPGFEELLMIDGSTVAGTAETVSSIVELTAQLLRRILQDHSITLIADVPLDIMTDLCNALLDLQNFSDRETLRATASMDGSPIEVFCELAHLVTPHTVPELMVYFEDVSWYLPRKLRELAERELTPEQSAEYSKHVSKHRELLVAAMDCGALGKNLAVVEGVRQGLSLGLPFKVYVESFGWQLAHWSVEQAGQELLAMALASRDAYSNPRAFVSEYIEHYVPMLDRITAIDVDITNRLIKINHEQA